MKQFLAILLILTSISWVQAQIPQGTIYAGAASNLSYASTGIDGIDDNVNVFNLQLGAGYFFMENLALGLNGGFSSTKFRGEKQEATVIGPFARYYINGQIIVGIGYTSTKFTDVNAIGSVPLELGYAAFLGDVVAIEPSIGYDIGMGDNNTNTISFNIGFGIYLNRK